MPLDIYRSEAEQFLIFDEGILPPFNAIPGLGGSAAQALVDARAAGPYLSVEDLKIRSKASQSTIEHLRNLGALGDLAETSQVSMF